MLACPTVAEASSALTVVGAKSDATLERIADGSVSFSGRDSIEARSFRFNFLPGAEQGPDTWYLIRLDLSVSFAPNTGPGSVLVSGFTRGQAGAQVEFYPGRDDDGDPIVDWGSVDLIRGQAAGRSHGTEVHLHYANYLPFRGVRPGPTALTLQVERFGRARVAEVKVGPASGIYATAASPVELSLRADIPDEGVLTAGRASRLEVEVSNESTRVARNVTVSLRPQSAHMFLDGPAQRTIQRLEGTTTTHFTLGRTRPGTLRVQVTAAAPNGSEALAVVESEVVPDGGGENDFKPWIALAIAAVALAGVAAFIRSRKKEGAKS